MLWGIAIAVGVGLLIAVQVTIVGRSAPRVGAFTVATLVHVGGLGAAIAWILASRVRVGEVVAAASGWWWWIVPGVAGLLIVTGIAESASRIGVAATLSLAVTAQLTLGLLLDVRAGVAAFNWKNVLGVAILSLGAWLVTSR